MTIPTLHVPLKDSPVSLLVAGINDTETVLELSDVSAFVAASITRLTLGFNEEETETVEVVSYEEDPSGNPTGEVTVIRGSDPYAWPSGTYVSRVFTASDLSEVHEYLEYLDDITVQMPKRQGEAGQNPWIRGGSDNIDVDKPLLQAGMAEWTGTLANSGTVIINFPIEFAQVPLTFVTGYRGYSTMTGGADIYCYCFEPNRMTIYWEARNPAHLVTSFDIPWLAIGAAPST